MARAKRQQKPTDLLNKRHLLHSSLCSSQLYPAFQTYLSTHISMLQNSTPDNAAVPIMKERQTEYDVYSAERDPATGMFAGIFGKEWADDFVYNHLFELSRQEQ